MKTYNFHLSSVEINAIKDKIKCYEDTRAVSIDALKIVQKYRGWISDEAIYAIADLLNISANDLEEIATFYSQIFRKPVGRHIIRFCDSIVCYINGYLTVLTTLRKILGIDLGQTTADHRFTLLPVSCLGNCDKSPSLMIDEHTHNYLTPEKVVNILELYE